MKTAHWYYRLPLKIAAFFAAGLLALTGLYFLVAAGATILLAGSQGTTEEAQRTVAKYVLSLYDWELARDFVFDDTLPPADVPYTYVLTDEDGRILAETYNGGPYLVSSRDVFLYNETHVSVTLYANPADTLTGDSWLELTVRWVGHWHTHRWGYCVAAGGCALLTLAVLIYLYCAAGHRYGEEKPQCNFIDRIPFDVFTALYGLAAFILLLFLRVFSAADVVPLLMGFTAVALAAVALALSYTMSLATRIKTRTVWSNTVLASLWRWLSRGCRAVTRRLDTLWQVLLGLGAICLLEAILLYFNRWEPDNMALLWLGQKALMIPLILWVAVSLSRLQEGIRRQAAGETDHQIPTRHLPGTLARTAEDVNRLGEGLTAAVENRLKSERFKTELITNVSHDIKTPLTSIINYVDLLEKEQPENEKMREYLAVLQRQSARLKKLIEDLVEASKASTGNLPVHPEPCRLEVLLEQVIGEYAERLTAGGLELVASHPDSPVTVLADGRHLWRVLDNLLNNVCKYAQPGTRVYLDLANEGGMAHIILRNISRSPLNISGEELLERFVRGDSSRNTEGSGLGLSIARSLVDLQGGALTLTVDGDLFKVCVALPLVNN